MWTVHNTGAWISLWLLKWKRNLKLENLEFQDFSPSFPWNDVVYAILTSFKCSAASFLRSSDLCQEDDKCTAMSVGADFWGEEMVFGSSNRMSDCEPPPSNTVKWLKLIQNPESSAGFSPPSCSSSFRRLQEKKKGTQWFPSGVSQTQTDYPPCETISMNLSSVYVQHLRRWIEGATVEKKFSNQIKLSEINLCKL